MYCENCDASITSITYNKTGGLCIPCSKQFSKEQLIPAYLANKDKDYPYKEDEIKTEILENIKWLDKLLWTFITFVMLLATAKILSIARIPIMGLQIRIIYGLILLIPLSIAHYYVAHLLLLSIKKAWAYLTIEERVRIFRETQSKSGIFIRGITPRVKVVKYKRKIAIEKWMINYNEPPIWISTISLGLLFLAVIPWKIPTSSLNLISVGMALLLVNFNWYIGSHWAVAFAELSTNKEISDYFKREGTFFRFGKVKTKRAEIWGSSDDPDPIIHHYLLTPFIILIQLPFNCIIYFFSICERVISLFDLLTSKRDKKTKSK